MYAELLEMHEEASMTFGDDGLPDDLEVNYIAVAPVPVGKRCLLVTQQSSGEWGSGTIFYIVTNTHYHVVI